MPVIIVSAPSGAGKTTLNRRLLQDCPKLSMSVSHTTRQPRANEVDGVHYHFVTPETFLVMRDRGDFLEWAHVHGNYYGTSYQELRRIQAAGLTPLLEIDVQGWDVIKPLIPDALSIFILPPSLRSLWERLEGRGSDPLAERWKRLCNAHEEIQKSNSYQVLIINRDLDLAFRSLRQIVDAPEMAVNYNNNEALALCAALDQEFHTAAWIRDLRAKVQA